MTGWCIFVALVPGWVLFIRMRQVPLEKMNTTHNYKLWFAPVSETAPVASPASHSAAPVQAGDVIASGSGNRNQSPPTHALQDKVTIPISVPSGVDAEGNPRPILARISATFRVEDWGFVTVDGKRILDMTSARESPGIYGGHPAWPAETASAVVASGEHVLEFHYENIEMADAGNNKLVCEYSYRVVALEDGGRKEEELCGCGGSTCSMDGGVPGARSGAAVAGSSASSSAGSEVSAMVTEDSLFWSCNVGALRGMGTSLGGKVVLQAKELSAALASPAALLFNHPMAARLVVPEDGVQPGCRMEVQRGNRVVALRYYTDGSIAPVGVDTAGPIISIKRPSTGNDASAATIR